MLDSLYSLQRRPALFKRPMPGFRHTMSTAHIILALVLALALPGVLLSADSEWFRMESEKFELYGSGNANAARATLRHFEEVRQVFLEAMPSNQETEGKVRIIAFKSQADYTPYRPGNYAVAYYLYGSDQDLIVLSGAGTNAETAAIHEYMHLLVRRAGLHLPPWLNEGFAELYSTMKPHASGVLIGTPLPARLLAIRQSRWVPLAVILATDQTTHAEATSEQATALYNFGWALTHMLALKEDYRDRWDEFITEISSGKDSRAVLERVYGRPLSRIETDLREYVRASKYTGVVLPVKLVRNQQEYPETPVDPLDARIMLADLKSRVAKGADRARELEAIVAESPGRPESYAALGYLAWRSGDTQRALDQFDKSYQRGNRERRFLADYGNLVNPADSKRGAEIFGLLIEKEPDNVKYRLGQAWALMNNGDIAKAQAALAPVRRVSPDDAARLFRLQSAIEIKLGNFRQALALTDRWLAQEQDPRDRQIAESQSAGLRRAIQANEQGVRVEVIDRNMRRPADMQPQSTPGRSLSKVTGQLTRLDCRGSQAYVVLNRAGVLASYLIDDREKVLIDETSGLKLELACGAQKAIAIELHYVPLSDGPKGVAGLVRGLKRLQ